MIHDPTTPEGRAKIKKMMKEMESEIKRCQKEAKENVDEEPSGEFTEPSELDIKRIIKKNEDR